MSVKQQHYSFKNSGHLLYTFVLLCALFVSAPTKSYATFAVSPEDMSTATCNPTYYESLRSRAWLEGNRRNRQAQNYIIKPDSVLDYNCFGILNNIAADFTERIFSEQHAGHCYPESLDCSLDFLVINALTPYLTNNFNHTFLGGRSNLDREAYDGETVEMCSVMSDVWTLAKCMNFMLETDQDGFFSFTEYTSLDPRRLPEECTTNVAAQWNDAIENAYRPADATSWYTEMSASVVTSEGAITQYLAPGNEAPPGCGEFIPTGIIVQDQRSIFYRTPRVDGICANPGCSQTAPETCTLMTF